MNLISLDSTSSHHSFHQWCFANAVIIYWRNEQDAPKGLGNKNKMNCYANNIDPYEKSC